MPTNSALLIATLLYFLITVSDVEASSAVISAELHGTVNMRIGNDVMKLLVTDEDKERKAIIRNGVITKYGQNLFGSRATYSNGTLTIKDLKESDFTKYFYHVKDKPMAITLVEEMRVNMKP